MLGVKHMVLTALKKVVKHTPKQLQLSVLENSACTETTRREGDGGDDLRVFGTHDHETLNNSRLIN